MSPKKEVSIFVTFWGFQIYAREKKESQAPTLALGAEDMRVLEAEEPLACGEHARLDLLRLKRVPAKAFSPIRTYCGEPVTVHVADSGKMG
jgi:peroxiredoxin family protein